MTQVVNLLHGDGFITYESEKISLKELRDCVQKRNILHKNKVAVVCEKNAIELLITFFAHLRERNVVALLQPNSTRTQKEAFIQAIDATIVQEEGQVYERQGVTFSEHHPYFFISTTSGSTGMPKPLLRTDESWMKSFQACHDVFSLQNTSHTVIIGSLYHSLHFCALLTALYAKHDITILHQFTAEETATHLQKDNVVTYGVPTMLRALLQYIKTPVSWQFTWISAGERLDVRVIAQFYTIFPNAILHQYYGTAEASFVSYETNVAVQREYGYVGKLFPHVQVEADEKGFLFIQSPFTASGTMENGDIQLYRDSKIETGDHGYVEDEGLFLFGRTMEWFKVGGVKTYVAAVEHQIQQHPFIKHVVVMPKEHRYFGHVPIAFVQLQEGLSVHDVRLSMSKQLPSHARPHQWIEVRKWPVLQNGKLDRKQLKEVYGL